MKKILPLIIFLVFAFNSVSAAELGLQSFSAKEQAILPSNPFYFLKSWTDNFRDIIFSDDPLTKTLFKTSSVNNKAAEIFQTKELSHLVVSQDQIDQYQLALRAWSASIKQLTSTNSVQPQSGFENSNQLYSYLIERVIVHERFNQEMEIITEETRQALFGAAKHIRSLLGREIFQSELLLIQSAQENLFVDQFIGTLLNS